MTGGAGHAGRQGFPDFEFIVSIFFLQQIQQINSTPYGKTKGAALIKDLGAPHLPKFPFHSIRESSEQIEPNAKQKHGP